MTRACCSCITVDDNDDDDDDEFNECVCDDIVLSKLLRAGLSKSSLHDHTTVTLTDRRVSLASNTAVTNTFKPRPYCVVFIFLSFNLETCLVINCCSKCP